MAELPGDVTWRRSSFSGGGNDCVEAALSHHHAAVRDSQDPAGATLTFGTSSWALFARAGKRGNPRSRTGT